ncbi:hypothetical protein [Caulobacter sp. NIBR2454]|nr:hypothetical protein [Caulobacter sp. NIBR2454]
MQATPAQAAYLPMRHLSRAKEGPVAKTLIAMSCLCASLVLVVFY